LRHGVHKGAQTYLCPHSGKVFWENNFITYCSSIREEFRWADELIALVSSSLQPKTAFFKEINDLKRDITSTIDSEREVLISPSEV
jgi:hypothetical protein